MTNRHSTDITQIILRAWCCSSKLLPVQTCHSSPVLGIAHQPHAGTLVTATPSLTTKSSIAGTRVEPLEDSVCSCTVPALAAAVPSWLVSQPGPAPPSPGTFRTAAGSGSTMLPPSLKPLSVSRVRENSSASTRLRLLQLQHHRPQGLTTDIYFSQFRRLEVRGQGAGRSGSELGFSSWLEDACPHSGSSLSSSSYKATDPIVGGPTLMSPSKPSYLPKSHLQTPSHWGQGFSMWIWAEQSQPTAAGPPRPGTFPDPQAHSLHPPRHLSHHLPLPCLRV